MLNSLPQNEEYVFRRGILRFFADNFRRQRKSIARKLQNPRIKLVTFRSLRHFKATMEYHKTKDILHVMRMLGHKNIKNTLVYTHLIECGDDEYVSKVARNAEEAGKLIEVGYEYVCTTPDELLLFRKRA